MSNSTFLALSPEGFQLVADALDDEYHPHCWSRDDAMWSIYWLIGKRPWRIKRLGLDVMMQALTSALSVITRLDDDSMRQLAVLGYQARKLREITDREPRDLWPALATTPIGEVLDDIIG